MFQQYRSPRAPELYVIRGLNEPLFMEYSSESRSWKFCHPVSEDILPLEPDFSRLICEQELCGGDEEEPNAEGYNFLT